MAASSADAGGGSVQEAPILPGFPDDVALRCLAFVPRSQHAHLCCVCKRWCALVKKGLSSFHALRRSMGLTQNYLLLFPNEYCHPDTLTRKFLPIPSDYYYPHTLPFFQIHPHNTPTLKQGSLRTPHCESEESFLPGHACISIGPFGLILGGFYGYNSPNGSTPSGQLHIFDTASVAWRRGTNMLFPRSYFAWGVIENRLYVAGGSTDDCNGGWLQQVEMYDFDADCWYRVADMPMCITVDLSFVYKGALYVRGCICDRKDNVLKLFSYRPSLNEWKEEEWMLGNVLKNVAPRTRNRITALQNNEDDTLYMLESQAAPHSGAYLKVLKRAPNASEWEEVFNVLDKVYIGRDCTCPKKLIHRQANFPSIGKQVVVMGHSSETWDIGKDVNVQTTHSGEVLMVSLKCPSKWDAVVIHE